MKVPNIKHLQRFTRLPRVYWRALAVCVTLVTLVISVYSGEVSPRKASPGPSGSAADADDVISIGAELERAGRWSDAVRHYEDAQLRFRNDDRVANGLRRVMFHLEISRRYSDRSFTTDLLTQSPARAFAALERVQRHIQDQYLEPISAAELTAHGTESLFLALADAQFVERNLSSRDGAKIGAFRRSLYENYWNQPVEDRAAARQLIERIAGICQREMGLQITPVVWEYVCGSTHSLDDYSGFLTPDMLREFNGRVEGRLVGIGVELSAEYGHGARLLDVFPSSPAERAGLQPGEAIVAVNGTDCREMPMEKITRHLLGSDGSFVELKVASVQGSVRPVRVTRAAFAIPSVVAVTMLDREHGIGYLRMTGFQRSTPAELDVALAELRGQGLRKLILDLRANAGGLLPTAISVADRFLSGNTIVSMKSRNREQNVSYAAHSDPTDVTAELIILIDGESASASEIVAAAVRDLGRGRLVGRKTFGKWCLQTVFPFEDGTGLRLTTATFYSPLGLSYGGIGLSPDVFVPRSSGQSFTSSTRETDLHSDPDVRAAMDLFNRETSGLLTAAFHPGLKAWPLGSIASGVQPVTAAVPEQSPARGGSATGQMLPRTVFRAKAPPATPMLQAADWPFLPRPGRGEYR